MCTADTEERAPILFELAHRATGDPVRARAEAERARRMSAEMGYHWGQVDAAEVLAALEEAENVLRVA
jgi:hypothetical protein